MRKVRVSVALARKVRDRRGVLVECLPCVERGEAFARLCELAPVGALLVDHVGARTRSEFTKILGPHPVIVARLETAGAIGFTGEP